MTDSRRSSSRSDSGRGHDHAAELDERDSTYVDGTPTRKQQHAQRLLPLSRAWQGERLGREPSTRCADRVEWIVFAAQSPLDTRVAADLEHRFTAISEVASKPRAVMAGALDRPATNTVRVPLREAQRVGVAACTRSYHRLRQHSSRGSNNDRECVLIAVRVDTDHVIHLVCKHPDRSSVRSKGPMTPV